jgi:hypothetical protein
MIDGLWIVEFHGPQGVGKGGVMLTRNQVLGGEAILPWCASCGRAFGSGHSRRRASFR